MVTKYMVRELRDDHVEDGSEWRPTHTKNLIGVLCYADSLPIIVSCGPVDYFGHLCLNKVYTDLNGKMHLSCTAQISIDRAQLGRLKREGKLVVDTSQGDPTVMLLQETLKPLVKTCGKCGQVSKLEECLDCKTSEAV